MSKEYRYQDAYSPYSSINFRYGDDGVDYRSRPVEPSSNGLIYLATEHDVISEWADFAKDALEGSSRESNLKCWAGHYEQFGMVMLNLANMTRYRKDRCGQWSPFYEHTLWPGLYDYIYVGPSGTECRTFYRLWFSIIGHPDYHLPDFGTEFITKKDKELALCIALRDVKDRHIFGNTPA